VFSFSNFHLLDPAARDVTTELLANAQGRPPSFMTFIYRWMGLQRLDVGSDLARH
jgi:hypothetical protein